MDNLFCVRTIIDRGYRNDEAVEVPSSQVQMARGVIAEGAADCYLRTNPDNDMGGFIIPTLLRKDYTLEDINVNGWLAFHMDDGEDVLIGYDLKELYNLTFVSIGEWYYDVQE